jgi:hypothetical protein
LFSLPATHPEVELGKLFFTTYSTFVKNIYYLKIPTYLSIVTNDVWGGEIIRFDAFNLEKVSKL